VPHPTSKPTDLLIGALIHRRPTPTNKQLIREFGQDVFEEAVGIMQKNSKKLAKTLNRDAKRQPIEIH
jgi:hypothetical protein